MPQHMDLSQYASACQMGMCCRQPSRWVAGRVPLVHLGYYYYCETSMAQDRSLASPGSLTAPGKQGVEVS